MLYYTVTETTVAAESGELFICKGINVDGMVWPEDICTVDRERELVQLTALLNTDQTETIQAFYILQDFCADS